MIKINLLPHRALKKRALERQFYVLTGLVLVSSVMVALLVYSFLDARWQKQESRNQFLKSELVVLDGQLSEIKRLQDQRDALLERKRVVEVLQENRTEAVRLLDQLVRQLPDGVYLKTVKQTGLKVNVTGYAQSSARVSALMRNIEASPWLVAPELVEIKAVILNNQRLNEFSLNLSLKRTTDDLKGVGVKRGARLP